MSKFVKEAVNSTTAEQRPYQGRIMVKMSDMFMGRYRNGANQLEPNARSVLVESPTGSGKTTMGLIGIKALQNELFETKRDDLVIGWVAMRRNLLAQAESENRKWAINLRNFNTISMFDSNPTVLLEAKRAGKKILLAVDEAQHDAASSMAHMHNTLEPDFILGLSATPFRADRVKLCFDKVIKDAGIHQLIQDGYLSKYHHYTVQNWNVETVCETYLRDPERWGKSAMYFKDLAQCHTAAVLLRQHGVVCDVVTGDSDWETQLEAFKEGKIPVLINCMKLTEGWDEPSLQTVFCRDSGRGTTVQICGRVFRKCKGMPFKQVVQSKQSRWPFLRTAMPEQQFIWQENEWLSLTVNPKLNLINQNARLAIASTEVVVPEFITKQGKGRPRKLRF